MRLRLPSRMARLPPKEFVDHRVLCSTMPSRNSMVSHNLTFFLGYVVAIATLATGDSLLYPNQLQRVQQPSTLSSSCAISLGTYHGPEYQSVDTIGRPQCLVENKFLKLTQHKVRIPNEDGDSSESDTIIPDWLFLEYHDTVNVLVEAPGRPGHVVIFAQTKYALEGRTSLAVVGGMVEPAERHDPVTTARREVQEEMGLHCTTFHSLGRYRTDVNRGAGWTNTYWATDCQHVTGSPDMGGAIAVNTENQVGALDTERQELQVISIPELVELVSQGDFVEIKWTATVALALLHPTLVSIWNSGTIMKESD